MLHHTLAYNIDDLSSILTGHRKVERPRSGISHTVLTNCRRLEYTREPVHCPAAYRSTALLSGARHPPYRHGKHYLLIIAVIKPLLTLPA